MKICKKLLKEIAREYNFDLGDNPIESIHENANKIDWSLIGYKKLSEDFIRELLSEDFISEFQDRVDWDYISYFQELSEGFIRDFQNKVNWCNIFRRKDLSKEFIIEFKDKDHWGIILNENL